MSNFLFKLKVNLISNEDSFVVVCLDIKQAKHPVDPSLFSSPKIGDTVYLWEHEDPRDISQSGRGLSLKGTITGISGNYAHITVIQRMGNRYFGKNNLPHDSAIKRVILGFSHNKFIELSDADVSFLDSIF